MMADRNRRRHRPHAAAAMLRLIAGVLRVPAVEVADDGDLLRVGRDEHELHALRLRLVLRREERAGDRLGGAIDVHRGVHRAEHGEQRERTRRAVPTSAA